MIIKRHLPEELPDFQAGVIMLVDKPYGWTSFDVVNFLRYPISRLLGVKRAKIGHAGTLDPLASGLLILCIGKFTKRIEEFRSMNKTYTGKFKFGATTPSFDKETEENLQFNTEHLTLDMIKKAAHGFIGTNDQLPPAFSAKKIGGKRAYEFARADQEVKLKTKSIQIEKFDVESLIDAEAIFEIECSTGTYIRAIARDIGERVHSGAYLVELKRTAIGAYHLDDAIDPQLVKKWLNSFIEKNDKNS